MGCDIHVLVQVKKDNGKWENKEISQRIERDYELFAILADVRNSYDIKPISIPKGMPDDLEGEYRKYFDDIYFHSHSYHSLKELQEYNWDQIIKFEAIVKLPAYRSWMKKGKIGPPPRYCQGFFGLFVIQISNDDMENIINDSEDEGNEFMNKKFKPKNKIYFPNGKNIDFYTVIKWEETYKEKCSMFYNNVIPELQKLADEYGGIENVRIVFCFDN